MTSKSFILRLLVPCIVVSFSSLGAGESTKTPLTVQRIAFTRDTGGIERVSLFCNQSCVPDLSSLEGENPRVVMDMKEVFQIQSKARTINTGGKLVKRVRSYLDKETSILRVVLDLEPSKHYIVNPMQGSSGNTYMLTIKDDTDSPLSQERRITILHPDLGPEGRAGKQTEAGISPERKFRTGTPAALAPAVQAPGSGGTKAAQVVEDPYREALFAQLNGDLRKAEALYRKALSNDPEHVRALNNLGVLYLVQGEREKAVSVLNRAIVLKKDYADPYYNLACLYARANEMEESLRYLKIAAKLDDSVIHWAKKDDDMKNAVASPEFKKLMEEQKN